PASIFQLWVGTDSCLLSCAYVCRIHVKLPTTLKLKFSPTLKDSKQSEIGSNLVLLGCCRREVRLRFTAYLTLIVLCQFKCTSPIAILQLPKGQVSFIFLFSVMCFCWLITFSA
ncbi:hypothetical protein glysoja_008941, partial [Glycine soja]